MVAERMGHVAMNSNDRAQILGLIHARHWTVEPSMAVESRELTISLGEDFAFADGLVCVSGWQAESAGPVNIWLRETMCFERCAEGWRVVREDTSAPLRMDDGVRGEPMGGSKLRVGWAIGYEGLRLCREGASA